MCVDQVKALRAGGVSRVLDLAEAQSSAAFLGIGARGGPGPHAVVVASSAWDVEKAVAVAAAEGFPIVPVGTGHGGACSATDAVVVATHELATVSVDPRTRTATVAAGTRWSEVLSAAGCAGLAPVSGSAPSVGVIGHSLGGGIGPLVRTLGASSDRVRSLRFATPGLGTGVASEAEHRELFWALRGGKSGLGVVTSMTIELIPIETIIGGGLYFEARDAEAVVRGFIDWAPQLPMTANASLAVFRMPDQPSRLLSQRDRTVVHVRYASLSSDGAADVDLARMRAVARPIRDTVRRMPYARLGAIHHDPPAPHVLSAGVGLSNLDSAVTDALVSTAIHAETSPVTVELRALGGAFARDTASESAVGARATEWSVFAAAGPSSEAGGAHRALTGLVAALGPWRGPENLINFVGCANSSDDVDRCWSSAQHARLSRTRAETDPDGLLRSHAEFAAPGWHCTE